MTPSVLFVDDDRAALESLVRAASSFGLAATCRTAGDGETALQIARAERPHVVVLDLSLDPQRGVESGFATLTELTRVLPESRIIVLTGHHEDLYGVRALDLGAGSFLRKPADIPHLVALIRDGITQAELRRECVALRRQVEPGLFIGASPAIIRIAAEMRTLAETNQPVFLCGETGTGKGVAARTIHDGGPRRIKNFVRYQPTFATPDLVQSDLFGHVRGAFTGATADRRGLIEEADGGTLFLDEIDELPPETQVLLLGVLQEKRFRPVGSSTERSSQFRLICATNRNPAEATRAGKLRPDLYHRIAHCVIELPPLRERRSDIPLLVDHILGRLRSGADLDILGVEGEALELLATHGWPGNVRELEGVIESAAYRARALGRSRIEPTDIRLTAGDAGTDPSDFHTRVDAFKRSLVLGALERHGGNQLRAAAELGLDRGTLGRILKSR